MSKTWMRYILTTVSLLLVGCSNTQPVTKSINSPSTIKIGGSAEVYEALELLTDAYQAQATTHIEFEFFPPSQTSGGIQGSKSTVIDIGGVSRVLTLQETGSQLNYIHLARTSLVVVIHNSVTGINNITSDQLKAIYSGQIRNWKMLGGPDEPIILFDFTEDENEKRVLRQTYLGNELIITPTAIVFSEDDELTETAAITEFSMATVPYEATLHQLSLTTLSIDGVEPSMENLQSGKYMMTLPLGIVIDKHPAAETRAFLKFATGLEGQQVLRDANYIVTEAN